MKKTALISLATTTVLMAGGYKIPESSLNAVALSNAYVASSYGADASYYNPANMVFSDNKGAAIEVDLTYIGLSKVDYKGTTAVPSVGNVPTDTSSEAEAFLVPTLHYVSPEVGSFRFGLSLVSPAGLSKKWETSPASLYSEEFTLQTMEINPTVAYKISDEFAVAFGLRGIRSSGIVTSGRFDLKGDGFDWGYNAALTYKPLKDTTLALTYRSNIDLHVSGDSSRIGTNPIKDGVKVSIPVPASANLAISQTYNGNTTVEFVLERTMWSAYKNLDFDFNTPAYETAVGSVIAKNWKDSNTYRLGLTHKHEKVTAMVGLAYDISPVPDATIGYENPDSNSKVISLGGRYEINEKLSVGLAGLVSFKDDRSVHNTVLNGEFSNSRVYLLTTGMEYKF